MIVLKIEVIGIKELYYVLMKNQLGNAKKCKTLIKHGMIKVNNQIIYDCRYLVQDGDEIFYHGIKLKSQPFSYYMMNKPPGYICANKDTKEKCVIDLIDNKSCYCLGRLDKNTTGLLIITDDVTLAKKLLLPQNHVKKKYLVETRDLLSKELVDIFKNGVVIDNNTKCQPGHLKIIDDHHCYITITEGKYHQIKKMFLSCRNQVKSLKRVEFAQIKLDHSLSYGQYRYLTKLELELLFKQAK